MRKEQARNETNLLDQVPGFSATKKALNLDSALLLTCLIGLFALFAVFDSFQTILVAIFCSFQ